MEGLKTQEPAATNNKRMPSEETDEEAAPKEVLPKRRKKEGDAKVRIAAEMSPSAGPTTFKEA